MNEAAIRKSLCELTEAITALPLPGGKKTASTAGVYESHGRPDRPVDELVDQLRLQIKYLLFDLEATRRENRYLRQLLETRPPRPDRDDKFDNPAQEF